jgi:hypothetical protein
LGVWASCPVCPHLDVSVHVGPHGASIGNFNVINAFQFSA